jgi:hypothetical protein
MTDYDKRYATAAAMMADLEVVRAAPDPFALRPADLPSVQAASAEDLQEELRPIRPVVQAVGVGAGSDGFRAEEAVPAVDRMAAVAPAAPAASMGGFPATAPGRGERVRPQLRVNRWWSGGYVVDDGQPPASPVRAAATPAPRHGGTPGGARRPGVPAHEQLRSARARAEQARKRALERMSQRRGAQREFSTFNTGVSASVLVFMSICLIFAAFMVMVGRNKTTVVRIPAAQSETPLLYAHGMLPDFSMTAASGGETVSIQIGRPERPAPRVRVQGVQAPVPPAPPSPPGPGTAAEATRGQRVLIVSDAQPAPHAVVSALARMSDAGFLLLGNYPGNPADDRLLEGQLRLEAEAKMVRGLGQLDSPDVSLELSQWIAANDDVDLLVWFGRTGNEKGPTRYWVYRAPDPDDEHRDQKLALDMASRLLGGR